MSTPFFDRPGPRWFSIPAHRPFVEDLASGLIEALTPLGPEALSDAIVLTPTRRGARALAEAFVAVGGGRAVLLPQIRALGDLDEGEPPFEPGDLALDLPPAISPWRRRFELARLVADHQHLLERSLDAVSALELADALAAFLDSLAIEEAAPPKNLDDWAPAGLAKHWQVSARFLAIALEAWPQRLVELDLVDVATRRVALLRALAERWQSQPPSEVLVAAGSTGTAPATAALLSVIARAPKGCVILPGLDHDLAEAAWAQVEEQHPQGAMKRLLASAGIERRDVLPWSRPAPGDARGRWRRRIVNEALRPAEATADWLGQIARLREEGAADGIDPITEGLAGLSVVNARTEDETASVAALLLREALETPGRTAALITPDAVLARRVSARLARWGIGADSSAGAPLAGFPAGELAGLVARSVADQIDPVELLAIVKHPRVRLGLDDDALEERRRVLERYGLRGPRPRDFAAIAQQLDRAGEQAEAKTLLDALAAALDIARAPFASGLAEASVAARGLTLALEALAVDAAGDVGGLWAGAGGEALVTLLSALLDEAGGLPAMTADRFADLVENLLAGETVRTGGANHPRLRILGAIEARLVRADLLVLAGLEEGVWPAGAPIDPFLSRPMRKLAGLPPPERRIGLSAHDFAQAACAPDVVLLHCERRGGAPAVASRWLWRLQTLASGAGVTPPSRPELLDWARALDAPLDPAPPSLRTAPRPRPTPPVDKRPVKLPVTTIEQWLRDPYSVYARRILNLRALERPDEPVEARIRGSAIHKAFERFALEHPGVLAEAAEDIFAGLLITELAAAGMPAARLTREQALARNVAPWVVAFERRRREGAELVIERKGSHTFPTGRGGFTLTATADRIEQRDGRADILDFKTGLPPSKAQVESGLSPQLTLTAAILHNGGFEGLDGVTPGDLVYVRVSGGRVPGQEIVRGAGAESLDLALRALEGLKKRVAAFDRRETPYVSWAAPQFIGQFEGDYDHLARLWEWHVIGGGDDDGGGE